MGAIFAGKMPHAMALTPGGVTEVVTAKKIAAYRSHLTKLIDFINTAYLEDVVGVAGAFPEYFSTGGFSDFLSYGLFRETNPRVGKPDAYTWLKAPRYYS
jgi:Ni,Fe-hydrogenase I large subunit